LYDSEILYCALQEQQVQDVLDLILRSHPELRDTKLSSDLDGMDGQCSHVMLVVRNLLSISMGNVATQHGKATLMQSEKDAKIKELNSKVQQLEQERDILVDHIMEEQARVSIKMNKNTWSQRRLGASKGDVSDHRIALRASGTATPSGDLVFDERSHQGSTEHPTSQVFTAEPPSDTRAPQGVGDRDFRMWSDSGGGRDATELKKALALLRSIKSVIEDMPDGGAQIFESLSVRLQLLGDKNCDESRSSSDKVSDGSTVGALCRPCSLHPLERFRLCRHTFRSVATLQHARGSAQHCCLTRCSRLGYAMSHSIT
jgi:hypothetical protein